MEIFFLKGLNFRFVIVATVLAGHEALERDRLRFAHLSGRNRELPSEKTLERDRFKWKQESSRFFEKKRRKKRLRLWAGGSETSTAPLKKVFLLLFVHKK